MGRWPQRPPDQCDQSEWILMVGVGLIRAPQKRHIARERPLKPRKCVATEPARLVGVLKKDYCRATLGQKPVQLTHTLVIQVPWTNVPAYHSRRARCVLPNTPFPGRRRRQIIGTSLRVHPRLADSVFGGTSALPPGRITHMRRRERRRQRALQAPCVPLRQSQPQMMLLRGVHGHAA